MKSPEHAARDQLLLTPGPLTTHATVQRAMLRDMGSRDRGFVIYPGNLTGVDCFRIGDIGQVFPADIEKLIGAVREVLAEMGVRNGHVAHDA